MKLKILIVLLIGTVAFGATKNLVPRTAGEGHVGTILKPWAGATIDTLRIGKLLVDAAPDSVLTVVDGLIKMGTYSVGATSVDTLHGNPWTAYLRSDVADTFTTLTGVKVTADTVNTTVLRLKESGGATADIIVANSTRIWMMYLGIYGGLAFYNSPTEGGPSIGYSGGDTITVSGTLKANAINIAGNAISGIDTTQALSTTITFTNGRTITFSSTKGP